MNKKTRTRVSSKEKIDALRRVIIEQVPISKVCEDLKVSPATFYQWRSQLFDKGEELFERKNDKTTGSGAAKRYQSKISGLEGELQKKNEVISELMEEYLKEKKSNGEI